MKDKVILITGGASGLGNTIAHHLFTENATIIVFDVNSDKLSETCRDFDTYIVDVTDYDAVQQSVDAIIETYGKIDVLINNAGVIHSELLVNITKQDGMKHSYDSFKNTLKVDLDSVFIMTSIVAEKMILSRTKGCIINISSICAQGNAGQTAYSAAKGGVESLTKTWGKELGVFGIRTNAIAPGFIDTPSTSAALNEETVKHIIDNTPLRALGNTGNIAQAVSYIINNDFVNASVLQIDGGLTL
ncbi:MAG: SDR family oxidoreductase [Gammaproteobacteria bacterium]|nr:SDR family oxidoreductase [Gammaproteobacteria bacterium]